MTPSTAWDRLLKLTGVRDDPDATRDLPWYGWLLFFAGGIGVALLLSRIL
jgi:hypothetical protein